MAVRTVKSHNFGNEHLATRGNKSDRTKAKGARGREGIRGMDQSQQIINGQTSVSVCSGHSEEEINELLFG